MTLVVTLRKFLSLLFSIWYFQVNITPDDIRFLPSFFIDPSPVLLTLYLILKTIIIGKV